MPFLKSSWPHRHILRGYCFFRNQVSPHQLFDPFFFLILIYFLQWLLLIYFHSSASSTWIKMVEAVVFFRNKVVNVMIWQHNTCLMWASCHFFWSQVCLTSFKHFSWCSKLLLRNFGSQYHFNSSHISCLPVKEGRQNLL